MSEPYACKEIASLLPSASTANKNKVDQSDINNNKHQ